MNYSESMSEARDRLFVRNSEREKFEDGILSTAYIQFHQGKWDGKNYWNEDDMYLAYDLVIPEVVKEFVTGIVRMDPYDMSGFIINVNNPVVFSGIKQA